MKTKKCCSCQKDLPIEDFGQNKSRRDGLQQDCRTCRSKRHFLDREKNNKRCRTWYEKNKDYCQQQYIEKYKENPELYKNRWKQWRKDHREELKIRDQKYYRNRRGDLRRKLAALKSNAKRRHIDFYLTLEELQNIWKIIHCPVCGIEMNPTPRSRNSPDGKSVDRIDPSGPYSKINCCAICYRCNWIKGFGTLEDHQRITEWMKGVLQK